MRATVRSVPPQGMGRGTGMGTETDPDTETPRLLGRVDSAWTCTTHENVDGGGLRAPQRRPRSASSRSFGIIITASAKIRRLIFDWPARRSTKTMGTSVTRNPRSSARDVSST